MRELDPPALHPRDEIGPAQEYFPGPAVAVVGQSVVPDDVPDGFLGHRRPPCGFLDADVILVFPLRRACGRAHPELRSNMAGCEVNLHVYASADSRFPFARAGFFIIRASIIRTAIPDLTWRGVKWRTRHPAITAAFGFSASSSKPAPRTCQWRRKERLNQSECFVHRGLSVKEMLFRLVIMSDMTYYRNRGIQ